MHSSYTLVQKAIVANDLANFKKLVKGLIYLDSGKEDLFTLSKIISTCMEHQRLNLLKELDLQALSPIAKADLLRQTLRYQNTEYFEYFKDKYQIKLTQLSPDVLLDAVAYGHCELVNQLVKVGFNFYSHCDKPIKMALSAGNHALVKTLLEHYINQEKLPRIGHINISEKEGLLLMDVLDASFADHDKLMNQLKRMPWQKKDNQRKVVGFDWFESWYLTQMAKKNQNIKPKAKLQL